MATSPISKFIAVVTANTSTSIDLSTADKFVERFADCFNDSTKLVKFFASRTELTDNYTPAEISEVLVDTAFNQPELTAYELWLNGNDLNINIVFRYTSSDTYVLVKDNATVNVVKDNAKSANFKLAYQINSGAVKTVNNVTGNNAEIKLIDNSVIEFSDGVSSFKLFLQPY